MGRKELFPSRWEVLDEPGGKLLLIRYKVHLYHARYGVARELCTMFRIGWRPNLDAPADGARDPVSVGHQCDVLLLPEDEGLETRRHIG